MTSGNDTFYNTFLKEIVQHTFKEDRRIREPAFRKFLIEKRGRTIESLHLLRESLAITIQKPQRCLYDEMDWYLAIDTYTSTFYVCYRDLMMVDIDYGKGNTYKTGDDVLAMLRTYAEAHPEVLMDVYASGKGVHVFLLHRPHDYHSDADLQVMLDMGCDFYYTIYTSLRGWSVRVNAKVGETHPIYTSLGHIGTGKSIGQLECLVKLHMNFLVTFQGVDPSKMF